MKPSGPAAAPPPTSAVSAAGAPLPHVPGLSGRFAHADLTLVLWMLGLTCIWGLNAVSVKVLTNGMSPVMGATLRNALAIALLTAYGLARGRRFFGYSRAALLQALLNGTLFAGEFIFSYSGARITNAGHFVLFLNTSPFVVAIGAHYLLAQDRLSGLKVLGLLGAFGGIVLLFSDSLWVQAPGVWRGDLLVLAGALCWGTSTLHVKGYLLGRLTPFQLLFIKLLVSTPLMLTFSRLTEPAPFATFGLTSVLMLAYQGGVVVFFSYMMFIVLLDRYQPSAVQSFVFLSPVWGVLAAIVLLDEQVSAYLVGGMALVGAGLYLVNRPRRPRPAIHTPPVR